MKKLLILFLLLFTLPVSAKQYSPTPYNIKFDIPDNYYVITYDTNDKALFQKLNIDVAKLKQMMLNKHILMICIDPQKDIEVDIIAYTDSNSRTVGDLANGKLSDKELLSPKFSQAIQEKMQSENQRINIENINTAKYLVVDANIQTPTAYGFSKVYTTVKNGMTIGINGIAYAPNEQYMFSNVKQIVGRIDYSNAENYTEQRKQSVPTYVAKENSNNTKSYNNDSSLKSNPLYKGLVGGICAALFVAIRYLYEWFKNRKNK